MKYLYQTPILLDVHMHRPHTQARNFMDALLAFWPGLQVIETLDDYVFALIVFDIKNFFYSDPSLYISLPW